MDETEDQISNLKDKVAENTNQNRTKKEMNEDNLRGLWNNIKHNNNLIIGVPEGENRGQ